MISHEHLNIIATTLIDMEEALEIDKHDRFINPKDIEMCVINSLCHRIHLYHLEKLLRVNIRKAHSPFDSYVYHLLAYLTNTKHPSRDLVRYEIKELINDTSFDVDHIEREFLRNFTHINFEMVSKDLKEQYNLNLNMSKFNSDHIVKKLAEFPLNSNMKLTFLACALLLTYKRLPASEISDIIKSRRFEDMFYDFFDSTVADIIDDTNSNSLNLMYYLKAILMIYPT